MKSVNICCNILWLVLIGWESALVWFLMGVIYCITIIGIPFGLQAFKLGQLALWPFGKEIRDKKESSKCCSLIGNIIWIIFGGLEICLLELLIGAICCITIVGIPFGMMMFKLAKLAICPFGVEIVDEVVVLEEKLAEKMRTTPQITSTSSG